MSADVANCISSGMQHTNQHHQQVSFHFWSCHLTEASPRYAWEPEKFQASSIEKRLHSKRSHDDENDNQENNGDSAPEKSKAAVANGLKNGKQIDEVPDAPINDDSMEDADSDFIQHVLKVNACILGPKAAGVHLIAVRTKCFGQTEPDACPIVCVDPDSQRTVSLGYEFVLDSQNEVTFELVEGAGPVWLTGLHQVRVHDPDEGKALNEDDDIVDPMHVESDDDDDNDVIDDSSRFRLAGVKIDEMDEDEEEDEDEDEEEDVNENENEKEAKSHRKKPTKSKTGKRSPITTAQLRRRKRRRLAGGDSDGKEDEAEGEGEEESTDV